MKIWKLIILGVGIFLIVQSAFSLTPPSEDPSEISEILGEDWREAGWTPIIDPETKEIIGYRGPTSTTQINLPTLLERWREIIGEDFLRPDLLPTTQAFPFSIQIVDPDRRIFELTLGFPEHNVRVKVSPEGIYDSQGIFRGSMLTVELDGRHYVIQVGQATSGSGEIKITITPQSEGFPIKGSYQKEFRLGDFRGEIKIDGEGDNPVLSITLGNPEVEGGLTASPEGGLSIGGTLQLGEEEEALGKGELAIKSFQITENGVVIDGGLTWRLVRGVYTLTLQLGEKNYLEITKTEEEVLDELAQDEGIRERLVGELLPGMTEEEIREELKRKLKGEVDKIIGDLKEVLKGLQAGEVVKVPDSFYFFLRLGQTSASYEKIMKLVLPLVLGRLALELSASPEMLEAKLVFSLTEAEDERGNPKIIWGIGIQRENGEIKGIFTATDSQGLNSMEIVASVAQGVESVLFRHKDLEARFTQLGFEFGTTEGITSAPWASVLEKMKERSGLTWRLSYAYEGGWELRLNYGIPYTTVKDGKKEETVLKTFFILSPQGVERFGIALPVGEGILEITPTQLTYTVKGEDYSFKGVLGPKGLRLEFEVQIGDFSDKDKGVKEKE